MFSILTVKSVQTLFPPLYVFAEQIFQLIINHEKLIIHIIICHQQDETLQVFFLTDL